jgi:hypothetical protein
VFCSEWLHGELTAGLSMRGKGSAYATGANLGTASSSKAATNSLGNLHRWGEWRRSSPDHQSLPQIPIEQ